MWNDAPTLESSLTVPQKVKRVILWPSSSALRCIPRRNKNCPHKVSYMSICNSITHNSQKAETNKCPSNEISKIGQSIKTEDVCVAKAWESVTANRGRVSMEWRKSVESVVIVAQLCEYTKNHWIVRSVVCLSRPSSHVYSLEVFTFIEQFLSLRFSVFKWQIVFLHQEVDSCCALDPCYFSKKSH